MDAVFTIGSPVSLVFCCQEWFVGTVQVKLECNEVDLCENSWAVHISHHNSGTVIDTKQSSINANRMSTTGFPTSHQPMSYTSPLTSLPQNGVQISKFVVFAKISTKNH